MYENKDTIEEIAIIGMAGRFPGAQNTDQFWQNLRNGVESITRFTDDELLSRGVSREQLAKPNYVKAGFILSDVELFDATFFGYSAADASNMDPQHRLFLEICWEAMESAGYVPDSCPGAVGVFGGAGNSGFASLIAVRNNNLTAIERFNIMLGTEPDYLAARVAYKLNLKGPALTIQTACSTSLVAVHQACQALLTYQCDMALAGGVSIQIPQGTGYLYQDGMIFSPDGHCRAFDARANGTVFSQGAGVVLLKRLSEALRDNDHILAVIKASAVNNDGALKSGFAAPSVEGQAEVIAMAHALGEIDPATIAYIEAHGTGTPIGDPIEIAGLTRAFRLHCSKTGFCAVGSVKTNIGHLDAAAGIAGLIKTVLGLKNREIPPSLHFTAPNPKIDWESTPFYVNGRLEQWHSSGHPRRAGVSSFGVGGTNAHVVLEEAPEDGPVRPSRPYQLLPFSAGSAAALDTMRINLSAFIKGKDSTTLADAAYTLQTGRKIFSHRGFIVCGALADSNDQPASPEYLAGFHVGTKRAGGVVFMFPGQGAQYVNMCRDLYEAEPVFRDQMDDCAKRLKPHLSTDLRDILYPPPGKEVDAQERLTQTDMAQPALFVISYSLARLLMHWGIHPAAMVGHSIGEYVAACLAGVFSLEDALRLVSVRGRLMQSLPPGAMLAVPLAEAETLPYLSGSLSLAAVNGPQSCVVSGESASIDSLEKLLSDEGIRCRRLYTSHAFHSAMVEPLLDSFAREVYLTSLNPPTIPFTSNVSGTWIEPLEAQEAGYWAKHLRRTVRFYSCMQTLLETEHRMFIEVGPGQTLCTLTRQHPLCTGEHRVLATSRHAQERKDDLSLLLSSLGQVWTTGHQIDWKRFYETEKRQRVPLPTYPFERKRYWPAEHVPAIEPYTVVSDYAAGTKENKITTSTLVYGSAADPLRQKEIMSIIAQILKKLIVGIDRIEPTDSFFDLGGDSLHAVTLFAELERKTGINLPLATLLDSPTLGELAAKFSVAEIKPNRTANTAPMCGQSIPSDPWASLIPIQPNGSRPPLFCVHGVGGNTLNYRIFISSLGQDQPIYGLQAKGLDGFSEPSRSIESMAKEYISEIRKIQPTGPYYLGGGSFGGAVALEMAQQLINRGQSIAFLVMFDTQGPGADVPYTCAHEVPFQKKLKRYLSSLRGTPANMILDRALSAISVRFQFAECVGYRLIHKPMPQNMRYWYLEKVNLAALSRYRPRYYSGHLTLFRAFDKRNAAYYPTHGWQGMARELTVEEIPGEHETLIEKPEVGQALKIHLLKAQERYST